jgi:hypothetical protein
MLSSVHTNAGCHVAVYTQLPYKSLLLSLQVCVSLRFKVKLPYNTLFSVSFE